MTKKPSRHPIYGRKPEENAHMITLHTTPSDWTPLDHERKAIAHMKATDRSPHTVIHNDSVRLTWQGAGYYAPYCKVRRAEIDTEYIVYTWCNGPGALEGSTPFLYLDSPRTAQEILCGRRLYTYAPAPGDIISIEGKDFVLLLARYHERDNVKVLSNAGMSEMRGLQLSYASAVYRWPECHTDQHGWAAQWHLPAWSTIDVVETAIAEEE